MSTHDATPDDIETAARALLEARMDSVRHLAATQQQRREQQAALETAEREDADAYAQATRNGWSDDELKKLGFEAPGRATARPRRARSRRPASAPADGAGAPHAAG